MQIKPASLFLHLSYSSENVIVSQHLNQDFSIKVAQEPQTNRHNLTSPAVWYGESVAVMQATLLCVRKRKTTKKVSIASADTQQALLMKKRQQIRLLICFFFNDAAV